MRLRNRNVAEPLQEMIPELPIELPSPFAPATPNFADS
jgi:hypothetical protein